MVILATTDYQEFDIFDSDFLYVYLTRVAITYIKTLMAIFAFDLHEI